MSTLFENYYDCLGHELHIGDTVGGNTCGYIIYGHIVELNRDKNGNEKYTIIPDIGYRANSEVKLKKQYKIGWKNVYLITVKKNKTK